MVCVFLRVERVADGLNDQMIIRTALDLGDGCSDRGMCFQGGWNFQVHSANPQITYFSGDFWIRQVVLYGIIHSAQSEAQFSSCHW